MIVKHTETVEGAWGLCKNNMVQFKGIAKKDLPTFIDQ